MSVDPKRFAGEDRKFFNLQQFGTLNTKAKRPAIGDQEFSWIENMMPIGDGNLRAMPSNGSSIYTAPGATTIIYMYFFNIGSTSYAAVFLNDGTAQQVNIATQAVTNITTNTGTFFPGSAALNNPAPACAQYGQSGIVIVTTASVNGYYAWDGTTLFGPGDAAPNWLTDTTPTSMPSGVSGTCVETYQNRVWIGKGATYSYSAPGNGASFSGVLGGGTAQSNDSFLRREITQVRQSNGFLYLFADSSVNVISNVQSAGSPVLTTFNNQNVDPQVGTPYHNSVQSFGRGLIFAYDRGVYVLIGGAAQKVSDMLDGLFFAVDIPFLDSDATIAQPSSAITEIYDVKVYMLLMPVLDPFTGAERLALVMWDGKKWFIGSQDSNLTFIATQEINSELTAYGTDGTHIFTMFTNTSNTLNKIWQTRLWPGDGWQITKQAMRLYTQAIDNSGAGYSITGTVDFVLENTGIRTENITITSASFLVNWQNSPVNYSISITAASSQYLSRTGSISINQQKFTISLWFKRSTLGATEYLYSASDGTTANRTYIAFLGSPFTNLLQFASVTSSATVFNLLTIATFTDTNWHSLVAAVDTTQATQANRVILYIDGVQVTSLLTAIYPSLNTNLSNNFASTYYIGRNPGGSYYGGNLAYYYYIDGQQLTPASFESGGIPITYTGTYTGVFDFFLDFSLAGWLGYDSSGENNFWQITNNPVQSTSSPLPAAATGTVQWQNSSNQNVYWTVTGLTLSGFDGGNVNARGNLLGLTLQSKSPDFTVIAHSLLYQNQSPLGA